VGHTYLYQLCQDKSDDNRIFASRAQLMMFAHFEQTVVGLMAGLSKGILCKGNDLSLSESDSI
jgi:hypothetical protein